MAPRHRADALPAAFDHVRPLTQLWLRSRLDLNRVALLKDGRVTTRTLREIEKERVKERKKNHEHTRRMWGAFGDLVVANAEAAEGDVERKGEDNSDDDQEVSAAQLDVLFYNPGYIRPFTLRNIRLSVDILRTLWPRFMRIAADNVHLAGHAVVYVASVVVKGLIPAARMLCSSKMLDLVETSLAGHPVSLRLAAGLATLSVVLQVSEGIRWAATHYSENALRVAVDYSVKRSNMAAVMDLAGETAPNPIQAAVVAETSMLAGSMPIPNLRLCIGSAWGMFQGAGEAAGYAISIGSQGILLVRTLMSGTVGDTLYDSMTWGNAILLALSLAPTALGFIHNRLYERMDRWNRPLSNEQLAVNFEEATLDDIAKSDKRRNELVLFGLKEWTLQRFDALQQKRAANSDEESLADQYLYTLRNAGDELIKNLFYILLATRAIPTNLTLGSIHLHQRLAEDIIQEIGYLREYFQGVFQLPFLLAALFIARDGPEYTRPTIDFEDHRIPGGMRIEARSLTYAYDEGAEPVLMNIDLVIEPGTSLAVVGYNGSGKTTLVKTLLGLNAHKGQLNINGHEITEYDPKSLHARMSCLFQDYARYDLRLRDNVGLGDTTRINDVDAINRAIDRGGADGVRDALGLDCWLLETRRSLARQRYDVGPGEEKMVAMVKKEQKTHDVDAVEAKIEEVVEVVNEIDETDDVEAVEFDIETEPELLDADSLPSHSLISVPDTEADVETQLEVPLNTGAISGGQWQRVALARAFMRAGTADLIVFDEPSASLDPVAEAELFDRIHSLSHVRGGGTTTIFISHRFNTVRRADKIAFMEKGRIIEYGSHEELLALKGKYHECFELQRRGFE